MKEDKLPRASLEKKENRMKEDKSPSASLKKTNEENTSVNAEIEERRMQALAESTQKTNKEFRIQRLLLSTHKKKKQKNSLY